MFSDNQQEVDGENRGLHSSDVIFSIEYSKSRSLCTLCETKISKEDVRISRIVNEPDSDGTLTHFHIDCFIQAREELGFHSSGESLHNFETLKQEDQEIIKHKIPKISRKRKHEEQDEVGNDPKKLKGDLSYEEKLKFAHIIAKPMAPRKLAKKVLKLVKKSYRKKMFFAGLKNTHRAIRRGETGLCVIASDVTPIDIISHVPVLCEDNEIPYLFIPLKTDISIAMGVKRPCVIGLIKSDPSYSELYDECIESARALPPPNQIAYD